MASSSSISSFLDTYSDEDVRQLKDHTSSIASTPPLSPHDIDCWQHHIDLKEFGEDLQIAARAVFPNETKCRYSKVSVLLLSWEDEDPQLPVSLEIDQLFSVFHNIYHFDTEIWKIPDENPHYKLNQKVLDFVVPEPQSTNHLKIVYYAGHGRLSRERTLQLTSWRNNKKAKCPTVKWSGIQNVLEEAESDILILLDCCASGIASTNSGSQANELIAACAYNSRANGVGPYSFTNALVIELKALAKKSSFTAGELYSNIFCRTQSRMPEDGVERHPAPIHLILTHERPSIRSIQLSVLPSALDSHDQSEKAAMKCEPENLQNEIADNEMTTFNTAPSSPILSPSSLPIIGSKAPRLVFSVRLKETIKASDLSRDLFVDWLREIPAAVAGIEIEAGFDSYSTLLIVSMPMKLASYIPKDPAIVCLGPITSSNQVFERRQRSSALPLLHPSRLENNSHATQQLHVSHVGEHTDRILPSASAVTETFSSHVPNPRKWFPISNTAYAVTEPPPYNPQRFTVPISTAASMPGEIGVKSHIPKEGCRYLLSISIPSLQPKTCVCTNYHRCSNNGLSCRCGHAADYHEYQEVTVPANSELSSREIRNILFPAAVENREPSLTVLEEEDSYVEYISDDYGVVHDIRYVM